MWAFMIALGCSVPPRERAANDPAEPMPVVPKWVNYCCASGPPGRGCAVVSKRAFRSCVDATDKFAMQCKRKLCNAAVPADACWCCREEPGASCVTRIHTPELQAKPTPPPPKPEVPDAKPPPSGTIWSPY